jgi:hypothetical protein
MFENKMYIIFTKEKTKKNVLTSSGTAQGKKWF